MGNFSSKETMSIYRGAPTWAEENKCYNKGGKYNLFDVDEQVSTVFDDKLKEKKKKR